MESSRKRYYKLLRDLFEGSMDFESTKTIEAFEGLKENLCNKLPDECQLVLTKFIRLRNTSFLLKRYASEKPLGSEMSYKVFYLLNELCSISANVFDALASAKSKEASKQLLTYKKKKDEIAQVVKSAIQNPSISKKEKIHIVAELNAVSELWHILESECRQKKQPSYTHQKQLLPLLFQHILGFQLMQDICFIQ
eukprot:TRINITY_DN21686_c0_g3_i1.p2 TRINITY_DN21686_c0_g3~~TRINITY_DN21686_c0_g3_i1.p2  ORF type:complete len:216 (-),score=9.71 TRINITY_DN21686_c0_g3_i1:84-668(-)